MDVENNEAKMLLKKIQTVCFAMQDIKLFLDTHPQDKMALETFGKYQRIWRSLVNEYEEKYGALTAEDTDVTRGWTWINDPWPWEMEANV